MGSIQQQKYNGGPGVINIDWINEGQKHEECLYLFCGEVQPSGLKLKKKQDYSYVIHASLRLLYGSLKSSNTN